MNKFNIKIVLFIFMQLPKYLKQFDSFMPVLIQQIGSSLKLTMNWLSSQNYC